MLTKETKFIRSKLCLSVCSVCLAVCLSLTELILNISDHQLTKLKDKTSKRDLQHFNFKLHLLDEEKVSQNLLTTTLCKNKKNMPALDKHSP